MQPTLERGQKPGIAQATSAAAEQTAAQSTAGVNRPHSAMLGLRVAVPLGLGLWGLLAGLIWVCAH